MIYLVLKVLFHLSMGVSCGISTALCGAWEKEGKDLSRYREE
jgi:hypothetical protein